MTDTQITVLAYLTVPPGTEQGVLDRFAAIVAQTRAEPGCLNYDFHQHPTAAHRFVFYENYVDQAAFDAHLRQPYIQVWTDWVREHGGHFDVDTWNMLSERSWGRPADEPRPWAADRTLSEGVLR